MTYIVSVPTYSKQQGIIRRDLDIRPDEFDLDYTHPLARGLVFAGLGNNWGSSIYYDSSKEGGHGTYVNVDPATCWNKQIQRHVLLLDASNLDYVETDIPLAGFTGTQPFTVSAFVNMSSTTQGTVLTSNGKIFCRISPAGVNADVGIIILGLTPDRIGEGTVEVDVWTHAVFQYTGNSFVAYVDGVEAGSVSVTGSYTTPTNPFLIGSRGGTIEQFDGHIADVIVHDRVLSPDEIADLADPKNVYLSGLIKKPSVTVRGYRTYTTRPEKFFVDEQHPLAQGLVFAGLGRTTGTEHYEDSSPGRNHGELVNMDPTTDWAEALGRNALSFDASNDHIDLGSSSSLNPTEGYAIGCWLSLSQIPAENTSYWAISRDDDTLGRSFALGVRNNAGDVNIEFQLDGVAVRGYGPTLVTNQTYHILATSYPNGVVLFVDGEQIVASVKDNLPPTTGSTNIGRRTYSGYEGYLAGLIADPLIYNRALSPYEIKQLADPENVMLSDMLVTEKPQRRISRSKRIARTPARATSVRPSTFELDTQHPLAQGLVFTGLGANAGSDTYEDSSPKRNHGELTGFTEPRWQAGIGRNALEFQGDLRNEYIQLSSQVKTGNDCTCGVWIFIPTFTGVLSIFSLGGAATNLLVIASTYLRFLKGGNNETLTYSTPTGEWVHFTVRALGTGANSLTYFINGTPVGYDGHTVETDLTLDRIGINDTSGGFDGLMADLTIHNRALTATEIRQLADPENVMLSGLIREPSRKSSRIVVPQMSWVPSTLKERPAEFELVKDHPLSKGLVFAGLGAHAGSERYHDSSVYAKPGWLDNDGATANATPYYQYGRTGLYFANAVSVTNGAYAEVPAIGALSSGTVAAHIRCSSFAGLQNIMSHSDWDGGHRIYLQFNTSRGLVYRLGTSGLSTVFYTATSGEDLHVAIAWDNGTVQPYVNGVAQGTSKSYTGTPGSTAQHTTWGSFVHDTTGNLYGYQGPVIDGVIYNRALTLPEIQILASQDPMLGGLIQPITPTYFPGIALDPVEPKAIGVPSVHTVSKSLTVRPNEFTLNPDHPLSKGLVFAGMGAHAGSERYHDSSPFGNHGTLTNMDPATDWVDQIGRNGLGLDGVDDRVFAGIPIIEYPFTMSCWAIGLGGTGDIAFSVASTTDSHYLSLYYSSSYFKARIYTTATTSNVGSNTFLGDVLAHYTIVFAASNDMSFYVNGQLDDSTTDEKGTIPNMDRIALGVSADSSPYGPFNGQVFDPLVHNRSLSPAEIQILASQDPMLDGWVQPIYQTYVASRNSHKRYWVGKDADFNKSHNWAHSPGIEGGADIPTTRDDIIIE